MGSDFCLSALVPPYGQPINQPAKRMVTLSHMSFYPIKSCAGIAFTTALLTDAGLVVDGIAPKRKSA